MTANYYRRICSGMENVLLAFFSGVDGLSKVLATMYVTKWLLWQRHLIDALFFKEKNR